MVDENTVGREPITIVEIDQDFCENTYGVSPCTAAVFTTGSTKCFNTFKTCQDTANYIKTTLTLSFCMPRANFPVGEYFIPSLRSVTNNPTEISIGGSDPDSRPLGRGSSVKIVFQDHPHDDKLVDPYRIDDRDYTPLDRSTFWAKWLSRNPFYQNRPIRILEGYIGQETSDMRTRHYIIQKIDGPDSKGKVTITAQDVLKLADDKRAQCPLPSTGKLDGALTDTETTLTLKPAGVGNLEYPASGTAIISSELVTYTRSGDAITLATRGLRGTDAESHEEDETFQQVKVVSGVQVDLVIKDLLENFADVDSSLIPAADWATEAGTYLAGFTLNTWITEPTGVSKLLSEIVSQCICYIYWDEVDQEIKFNAIRPAVPDETIITDINENEHIVADSLKIERRTPERLSQIWVYYDQNNPTESLDKSSNYLRLDINIDTDAETEDEYGERRVKNIHSRWFDDGNAGAVSTLASRLLLRYRDDPIYFTFSMDAKDRSLLVSDVINFSHRSLVDFTGKPRVDVLQIVKVTEKEAGHLYEYRAQAFGFAISGYGSRYAYIMDDATVDYDAASEALKEFGSWICDDDGSFSDDDGDGYRIV